MKMLVNKRNKADYQSPSHWNFCTPTDTQERKRNKMYLHFLHEESNFIVFTKYCYSV